MAINSNIEEFHKSIRQELEALKNRVRNLIGDAHWGEEGTYKEAVLKNIIKKFITDEFIVGTGFVVSKTQSSLKKSKQIDILIIDKSKPVLFSEGEFIITTPSNVRAIIEVKTTLAPSDIPVFESMTKNADLIGYGDGIFSGIFSFESPTLNFNNQQFEQMLKVNKGRINHICFGSDHFVKYWYQNATSPVNNGYRIYNINGYAFTYFISNLVSNLYGKDIEVDRGWFLYPIPEGKEAHGIKDVLCI